MNQPQISFQVRCHSTLSLRELADRVGAIVGCEFGPSQSPMFEAGEALEATCLGLEISLSHDPQAPEGSSRTYVLMGGLRRDIEARWALDPERIGISGYVLGLMQLGDDHDWYIADAEEKRREAGL